jgi:hypothetical protein
VLLRAAGLARDALRLRDTDEALRETAREILRPTLPAAQLEREVHNLVARANMSAPARPAHRALATTKKDRGRWQRLRQAARELAAASG